MNIGEVVTICIKYNGKQPTYNKNYNRDLIKYLEGNIDILNGRGKIVDLRLVDENDEKDLEKIKYEQGVKKLPVLLRDTKPFKIYGTPKIKDFLKSLCNSKISIMAKNPDEEIRDFHMSNLLSGGQEDENINNDNQIIDVSRAVEESQRRKNKFKEYNRMDYNSRRMAREERQHLNHKGIREKGAMRRTNNYYDDDFIGTTNPGEQIGTDIDTNRNTNTNRNRNIKMSDNPAMIQKMCEYNTMEGARDNDLMAKFWDNNSETPMRG